MDVAKLAAYLLGTRRGSRHALGRRQGDRQAPAAGAGADDGRHRLRGDRACRSSRSAAARSAGSTARPLIADWAVLDAELTLTCRAHVTAATGIDAMVHAIEAYTSARLKNPVSDMLAREALHAALGKSAARAATGRTTARRAAQMLLGAHLAGVAFANAPVAGVHALAYPLGGHFHVPHGLSNALMLSHVLGHNMRGRACRFMPSLGALLDPPVSRRSARRARRRASSSFSPALSRAAGVPQRLSRGRHRTRASGPARRGGDEAGAAAGQQSLPDQRRPTRGDSTRPRCEPGAAARAARGLSRSGARSTTRWADNDAYGHVNNVVYYRWFDTAVNAWLIEHGLLDIARGRSDRPRGRNRLPLRRARSLIRSRSRSGLGGRAAGRLAACTYRLGVFAQGRGRGGGGGAFHPCLCRPRRAAGRSRCRRRGGRSSRRSGSGG